VRILRIAAEPALARAGGERLAWAWRTVLTGLGYGWRETPAGEECDLAYGAGQAAGAGAVALPGSPGNWGPDGPPEGSGDILAEVFASAAGLSERGLPRNRHGHLRCDDPVRRTGLAEPPVMARLAELERRLGQRFGPGLPRWPAGRGAAWCLTHDVDYPEAVRWIEPARIVARNGPRAIGEAVAMAAGRRSHWQFDAWMGREEAAGIRSSFHFCARRGSLLRYATGTPDPFYDVRSPRFRRLFAELAGRGFEIALHASYRAMEDERNFAREKGLLEEAAGRPVAGVRHHYWRLDPRDPEATLAVHGRLGFAYDASLAHERYLGWRRGLSWPFFPFDRRTGRSVPTLQLSTAWTEDHFFGHRRDNPGDPDTVLDRLADRAARDGGCLVLNAHDYVLDDRIFPGRASLALRLAARLAARGDFWNQTPAEVARHWTARARRIAEASDGFAEAAA